MGVSVLRRDDAVLEAFPGVRTLPVAIETTEIEAAADVRVREELARELHDGVAQTLTTMLLELEMFRREQYGRASVQTAIEGLQHSMSGVLTTLRELLYELRSERVAETRFVGQVRDLLDICRTRYGLDTRLEVAAGWPATLSAPAAANVLRVIEEAIRNAAAHAQGTAVEVRLGLDGTAGIDVSVSDNGSGVAPSAVAAGAGFGVIGMRERALLLGGSLGLESVPGTGTTIRLRAPLSAITIS